jgi:hypothetical protein
VPRWEKIARKKVRLVPRTLVVQGVVRAEKIILGTRRKIQISHPISG